MKGENLHLDLESKLLEVMKYGASHNVKQLVVEVGPCLMKDLELPPSIFHCHSLAALKLDFSHPASHDYIKILFPKSLNLPALKTLYLSFLTFTTSENGCAEPFSACIGDTCMHTRVSYINVVFRTPKLKLFSIQGFLGFVSPLVCKLPSLEEAIIDYGCFDNPFKESLLIDWLHLLVNVKIMRISFRTLCQINTFQKKYPTRSIVPCFVNLKSLKVKVSDSEVFDEKIRGEINEMVPYLLQNSLHAKVDTILYPGSIYRKSEY
ncbi:hypothetical protein P8452_35274 [Trifolium repens]|nr:hypothetical protein P8452_35274 [Trifolium repens]